MARYLVLANQTASSLELSEAIGQILQQDTDAAFVLVVPTTPVEDLLDWQPEDSEIVARRTGEAARAQLFAALERMVGFVVASPQAGEIVQFVLRELSHPTAALDRIYAGVFEPTHRRLCQVWEQATGEPAESEATKLTVFTMIGQVIYFRIGREAVLRRMGWREIGGAEAAKVVAVATANLGAMLAARDAAASKSKGGA